jgi:hypothetical protein
MRYEFVLTGRTALLMHSDDVTWADEIDAWRLDSANAKKKGEKSGDDRRPAWTWLGYTYRDGGGLMVIPGASLTSCLKRAGSRVPFGRNKTFKELAVSGIFIEQEFLAFANGGKPVPFGPLAKLHGNTTFKDHLAAVEKAGFKLFVKRAAVGASKHVRVRPRFDEWAVTGSLEVTTDQIDDGNLRDIFAQAGRVGLGDWRPGSPKSPGPFGMFEATLKRIK